MGSHVPVVESMMRSRISTSFFSTGIKPHLHPAAARRGKQGMGDPMFLTIRDLVPANQDHRIPAAMAFDIVQVLLIHNNSFSSKALPPHKPYKDSRGLKEGTSVVSGI